MGVYIGNKSSCALKICAFNPFYDVYIIIQYTSTKKEKNVIIK